MEHRWDQNAVLTMHNLGAEGTTARVRPSGTPDGCTMVDVFSGKSVDAPAAGIDLPLDGYGFRWLRIQTPHELRLY